MIDVKEYLVNMPNTSSNDILLKTVDETPQSEWKELYIQKLITCYMRMGYDLDSMIGELGYCLNWLDSTDFFVCPASTKYHDSFQNGLLYHSLLVADKEIELLRIKTYKGLVKPHEAILVALVHDWCKIGLYESYEKNVKDSSGNWVKEPAYKVKDNPLTCFGHGVSSMTLAQRFFRFTDEMLLAIRWHMGWCNICEKEKVELTYAENHYPLVNLIAFADKLAITEYRKP